MPSLVIAAFVLIIKPIVFRFLLFRISETSAKSWEIGFRLGQISEFSLLIVFIAASQALISSNVSHVIQATAIITFLLSSYVVVFRFPTPIAASEKLRRD